MNTSMRLGTFAIALVAMLGAGYATGEAVGPAAPVIEEMDDMKEPAAPRGEGVIAAAEGYRLDPYAAEFASGKSMRFQIIGPDGSAVTKFDQVHERDLHLILVNRELTAYHHLHPELFSNGVWSFQVPELQPGSYRAVADFQVSDGPRLALGTDLAIAGAYAPAAVPDPATSTTVDGYEVSLATDGEDELTVALTVRRGGELVTDLQPYLGASGHLVAMRRGDLAYAHVHPVSAADGTVRFAAALPSAGRYRLFFDFRHGDVVRTASFTFDYAGGGTGHSGTDSGGGH